MKWYNILAAPLALIYGVAVLLRNGLYKTKLLHSTTVPIPTICVGNLAVGGTGKTPFIEYLIDMLEKDYRIAVLSRGYKRSTHGFVLAGKEDTAATLGDEPMQIHTKYPRIPVAVCKDRVHGIRRLKELYPHLQVVLLDDAYQYRRLKCGFYILLTAYDRLYIDDHFLPMGRLRDSRLESLRASAVVVTKCPSTMLPIDQRIVDNKLHLPSFQQLCFANIVYPTLPSNRKILLLTGIAHPEYLQQELIRNNNKVELMAYPDHHLFTQRDISAIEERAKKADMVLTTEKDYARLQILDIPAKLASAIQSVPIHLKVYGTENLERRIRQYINENLHTEK